jgi:hypothetical protein
MKKEKKKGRKGNGKDIYLLPFPAKYGNNEINEQQTASSQQHQATGDKEQKSNKWAIGNWSKEEIIGAFGVLANVVLVALTYSLLTKTERTIEVAEKTIAENNKAFSIQNMPFLQVQDMSLHGDTMYYTLANLGGYPAKIESGKFGMTTLFSDEFFYHAFRDNLASAEIIMMEGEPDPMALIDSRPSKTIPLADKAIINNYVTKEYPVRRSQVGYVPKYVLEGKSKDTKSAYFFGEIFYINEVTQDRRSYVFTVKISGFQPTIFEFTNNKNTDLP